MRREPHPYLQGELVVVIDCSNLDRSAEFFTGVRGYARDGVLAGRYQSLLSAEVEGAEVLLRQVPDGKHGKNRVHLDLRTRDLESEIRRLARIGALVLTQQPVIEAGWRWHIPADPDGSGSASCSRRLLTGHTGGVAATVPVACKEPWHARSGR